MANPYQAEVQRRMDRAAGAASRRATAASGAKKAGTTVKKKAKKVGAAVKKQAKKSVMSKTDRDRMHSQKASNYGARYR